MPCNEKCRNAEIPGAETGDAMCYNAGATHPG
jgi:hypothetical protein